MADWSGGSGHWDDDPDNPFNRMAFTRGGGGLNNSATRESNAARVAAGHAPVPVHVPGPGGGGTGVRTVPGQPTPSVQKVRVSWQGPQLPAGWTNPDAFKDAPEIGGIENRPLKRVGIGAQQEAPGAISDIGFSRTATGWVPVPSDNMKERIEDDVFMQGSWFVRNYLGPMFGGVHQQHVVRPPWLQDEYAHFIPILNEWREGGNPRRSSEGSLVFTGGGF